ncbi:MAG TPA: tRNA (N6-isopentenyl adenosine(37)-C2)-methylthiotransferase MiaB [Candidatus Gracilibacteria bacterium]|nr:tRNA (N6-isopentenyl adenosine(37)-C2)-methylthiotransferase MiaB [Candidatus Gracilibacteria bacterium]
MQIFGCAMNYADAERVAAVLNQAGGEEVGAAEEADLVVMLTCAIKQKAEDKVFSTLHNLKAAARKQKKDLKVVLTGCMVKKTSSRQTEKADPLLHRLKELDYTLRIEEVSQLAYLIDWAKENNTQNFWEICPHYHSPFQAIVPIQTGCDNFCTYCIVPFTRGREYSRPYAEIEKEVQLLAQKGVKEILLVGQNVNSYGKNWPELAKYWNPEAQKWEISESKTPFSILLTKLNAIPGIERIRFSSSNPHDMTEDIIETITSLAKIMPALHFALQSGDNEILKRMNRKHTYEEYREIVHKIRARKPDFAISTDIIVGFCGETEDQFQHTCQAIRELDVDLIYISPYSMRTGTPASKSLVDDIPAKVKNRRWHELNNILKEISQRKLATLIGTEQLVLIEKIVDGLAEGKTEHNRTCQFSAKEKQVGDIVKVKITKNTIWSLTGELI